MDTIRPAIPEDIPFIKACIHELAEYEHAAFEDQSTEELLRENIFEKCYASVLIAEADGAPAGFALWFHNFSTWLARPGIYLEDLYIRPQFRKRGLGKALLRTLAGMAVQNNWGRIEWWCLKWNTPSLEFYNSLGARRMEEWLPLRLEGESLKGLSAPSSPTGHGFVSRGNSGNSHFCMEQLTE